MQPGQLDIVLVAGPDPTIDWAAPDKKDAVAWLAAQAARPEVDILSICTGIFLSGAAGLLTGGRKACGPRGLQGVLKGVYPGVEWVGEEVRWVRDGNFWSSGMFYSLFPAFSVFILFSSMCEGEKGALGVNIADCGL